MTIYNQIKEEIKNDYYIQNYENEGQSFVAWYLLNIFKLDRNQTKDAITDGADDKQIDAIVIDDDKEIIFIIQGKFISSGQVDAKPLREIMSSWLQIRNLEHLQTVGNVKLQRKLSEVARALEDEYRVCFELVTTASLTSSAKKDLEIYQIELSENEDFDASIKLVDEGELVERYELSLGTETPQINYSINLKDSKYMSVNIADTKVVIATIPLKEVVSIPGIKDGSLFEKNVRQSLGNNNTINKKIRQTILDKDKHKDFFFFHNGITAICEKLELNENKLKLYGLSVVNGCQSLSTIQSCSETAKKIIDTFLLFRFYEIPERQRADLISINTNSQSVVKARDLRSNDKRVLKLKRIFEQKYNKGYLITKRGESAPADKEKKFTINLSDLGKYLIAWHLQRPNISYGEKKIFDNYFETLFKNDHKPENIQSLNNWMQEIMTNWTDKNPLRLNKTLLIMKAYAPYHQLYAVSRIFAIGNNKYDKVPTPSITWENSIKNGMVQEILKITGSRLNRSLDVASTRILPNNIIFSPQNWVKSKQSLTDIDDSIKEYFNILPTMDGGEQQLEKLKKIITLRHEDFEDRFEAE